MAIRGNRTTHSVDSTIGSVGAHEFGMPTARNTDPTTSAGLTASCPSIAEATTPTTSSTPRLVDSTTARVLTAPAAAIPRYRTSR